MKYFLFLSTMLLFSCSQKTELAPQSKPTGEGTLKVTVSQPIYGPGPGMLVHLYFTEEDLRNRKPYESKITDVNGVAFFKKYHSGFYYVDCRVEKDSMLYAFSPASIPATDTAFVNLILQ